MMGNIVSAEYDHAPDLERQMVNKTIDLGNGLNFKSIAAGKQHFDQILKNAKVGEHFAGQDLQAVQSLYETYCRNTNWTLKSPISAFFAKIERGKGFATRCFGVQFEDGSTDRFSLDRALSASAGKAIRT